MIERIEDLDTYFSMREKLFGMNFGLERMYELLKVLDVQHDQIKFVHIAGTNGKGSTVHYLKKILSQQGYKVGTFTSPHIERIEERIMINDDYINEADFLRLCNKVISHLGIFEKEKNHPTQFEMLTVIALLYFLEQKPDLVIMETGLGGRLDSTNVINPLVSIITNISFDHMNILGHTITSIASEKAGIIKENSYVVTGIKNQEALGVVKDTVNNKKCELYVLNKDFNAIENKTCENGEIFTYVNGEHQFDNLTIPMLGKHQVENATLAITTALLLQEKFSFLLDEISIRQGLENAMWRGRIETISLNPPVIVDGSHNEEGIQALVDTLKKRFDQKKIIFVVAALADKDVGTMIGKLEEIADHIICTEFDADRALSAEKLVLLCKKNKSSCVPSWKEAIEQGISRTSNDTVLVVTGSLYFLHHARPFVESNIGTITHKTE